MHSYSRNSKYAYKDQLLGAACTRKLFDLLFFSRFQTFCSFFTFFSDFSSEINKKRLKMNNFVFYNKNKKLEVRHATQNQYVVKNKGPHPHGDHFLYKYFYQEIKCTVNLPNLIFTELCLCI